MEQLLPASFTELLAGILLLAALFVALSSLSKAYRRTATKTAGILFVASLCLFSQNGWVYFVGVVIIATSLSELDFLRNVSAAIRGERVAPTHTETSSEQPAEGVYVKDPSATRT
jgi:hypothetical protein